MEVYFSNMKLSVFKKENDINQQRALFKECFPENNGTSVEKKDHYLWKFHSFPSTPTSYEYGAYIKEKLIGYYAALPYEYMIDGKMIKVGMVCDVMTGIEARGKGVFTKMGAYSTDSMKDEELEFTIGYPIRPEVIPGHIKVGWEKLFALPLYIKFLSSKSLLKNKKINFLYPIIDLCLVSYNYLIGLLQYKNKYDIQIYNSKEISDIRGLDLFLQKWISEQEIALNKKIEFLKWRLGAPGKNYKIIIAKDSNEIIGLCIVSEIIKENVPSLAILDLSCLKYHKKAEGSIFSEIESYARDNKLEAIMIMASSYFSKRYSLVKNGFIKSPHKFWLIVKNLNKNYSMAFLRNEKNWHLTWIDSDDL
tara:strand:- start:89 stop:1180 length:1092 start_codon:yes stop_codon:yes gene_type:complete